MEARRVLVLALAAAMQILAWREAVPVCVSMAHCGGMPAAAPRCDAAATITGTADCCKSGSVAAPAVVSPMPQRVQSVPPALAADGPLPSAPVPTLVADRGRAAVEASPPLPPLLSSCILRI